MKTTNEFNVYIEIPKGGNVKYELDEKTGLLRVDRITYTSMVYPFNYGFIPETHGEDNDPIDVMVISSSTFHPGTNVICRAIGLLEMEDEAGIDTKIIALPSPKIDPFLAHISDISQIDETTKKMIKHFFDHYKELEPGKWVKTKDFLSKSKALETIINSFNKHA